MAPPSETTDTATFILRIWREWDGTEMRWRGRIDQVGSGRHTNFLAMDEMLEFLRQLGFTFPVQRPTRQVPEAESPNFSHH